MKRQGKTVDEFAPYISGDDAPIIVGGQAVNIWSTISVNTDSEAAEELIPYQPFTSKDCDVLGDRELLHELARKTQLKLQQYRFGQPTCCIGILYDPEDPEKEPVIEVLSQVRGLGPQELNEPVNLELMDLRVRTLNPIRLLKAKLANVSELPQENRQDVRHVQMLVPSIRVYLTSLHDSACQDAGQVTTLKQALQVCLQIVQSQHARYAAMHHRINFMRCLPLEVLRGSPLEAARNFVQHRVPRIQL